jgi:protoporphyrinogen IX oxidase
LRPTQRGATVEAVQIGTEASVTYGIVKALHIIGFTCWFAGLFYVVRLFIYNTEARQEEGAERLVAQLSLMQTRLWKGITNPAMVLTVVFGLWLVHLYGTLSGWVTVKLALVGLLLGYHHLLGRIHRKILNGTSTWSSRALRMLNEGATLFLVAIVFVAVLKNSLTLQLAATIMGVFALLLIGGFVLYQKLRTK